MRWLNETLINGPHLALATTEKRYKRLMDHCSVKHPPPYFKATSNASTLLLENEDGRQVCVVTLHNIQKKTDLNVIHALLVHEAVHVWQHKCVGMGETSPSSEFEAYSIQAIAQELFDEYARQIKK